MLCYGMFCLKTVKSGAEEVDLGYINKADQAHICIFVY